MKFIYDGLEIETSSRTANLFTKALNTEVNPKYNLTFESLYLLAELGTKHMHNPLPLINLLFLVGYLQGKKACEADLKKAGKCYE